MVIKGTEQQRKQAREMVLAALDQDLGDEEVELSGEQMRVLTSVRGTVRRGIQVRSGARLVLKEEAGKLILVGTATQRALARQVACSPLLCVLMCL